MKLDREGTPIDELRKTKTKLNQSIQVLNHLNEEYKDKQQRKFISTFLHLMDKMSSELAAAHEHYRNIDKEIEASEKCVKLKSQLNFFRGQCIQLKKQLQVAENELILQKKRKTELLKGKDEISVAVTRKVKQIQRYKSISAQKPKHRTKDMGKQQLKQFTQQFQLLQEKQNGKHKYKYKFILPYQNNQNFIFADQKPNQFQTSRSAYKKGRHSKMSKQKSNRTDQLDTTNFNTPRIQLYQTSKTFRNSKRKFQSFL